MELEKAVSEMFRSAASEAAANGATLKGDLTLSFPGVNGRPTVSARFGYGNHDYRVVMFRNGDGPEQPITVDEAAGRFAAACHGRDYPPPQPAMTPRPRPPRPDFGGLPASGTTANLTPIQRQQLRRMLPPQTGGR